METVINSNVSDVIITVIVAVLSSTGLWKYLETKREKIIVDVEAEKKTEENVKELLVALAKTQICHMSLMFIERGYITNSEADILEQLFTPYHELGGNGSGESLYKQAMNLPRKSVNYEKETS